MAISSASGFSIGSSDAIDDRFVLTKAQMLSANDNVFPQVYFAICSDDGSLYIYNKSNTASETTGKFVKFGGLSELPTTETVTKLNTMIVGQDGTWKEATLENAIKGISQSSLTGNTGLPVNDITIYNAMGSAGGFATLDTNGRIPNSQLPTSASQIVGYFDSANEHELPDISSYNPGNILIVISNGYYIASTAMTLEAGKTLTTFEATQANLLIAAGYVFTLTDSDGTTLGTVSTFATNRVTLTDTTEIDLPYTKDLTATSTPDTVQIPCVVGDEVMNIDSHWVHLSNSSSVTSVNSKTGAVVLSASDVGAIGTSDILTAFEETTSDEKVVSEKLVKNSLDAKLDVANPVATGSFSLGRKAGTDIGGYSVAEGENTTASGSSSLAEGVLTTASGIMSHAEGYITTASGIGSHAEGYRAESSGDYSHAEGRASTSSGYYSHAEGEEVTSSGQYSHAEGSNSYASGKYSHAEGYCTKASSDYQHVQGKFNAEDTAGTYANIVGGGTAYNARKNIYTLDWSGNGVYAGDVKATDSDSNQVSLLDLAASKGAANGIATLDSNGKLPSSQLPTSARQIKGQFDASATHTLPDISDYNTGDELLVVGAGYYTQSTAFTLTAGNTLTDMEVAQANALIAASYVFTLKSGDTTLGTVKTFATDKVTLSDDTEIALPYASDLSATSEPSEVQVTVAVGDEIINIDSHWIWLSNTSNVTSVNEKTGAVVLSASDVGAIGTDEIATTDEIDALFN